MLLGKCRAKHGVHAGELVWGDLWPRCSTAQSFVDTRERAGRGEFDVGEHQRPPRGEVRTFDPSLGLGSADTVGGI